MPGKENQAEDINSLLLTKLHRGPFISNEVACPAEPKDVRQGAGAWVLLRNGKLR